MVYLTGVQTPTTYSVTRGGGGICCLVLRSWEFKQTLGSRYIFFLVASLYVVEDAC